MSQHESGHSRFGWQNKALREQEEGRINRAFFSCAFEGTKPGNLTRRSALRGRPLSGPRAAPTEFIIVNTRFIRTPLKNDDLCIKNDEVCTRVIKLWWGVLAPRVLVLAWLWWAAVKARPSESSLFNRKSGLFNRKSGFFNRKSGLFHRGATQSVSRGPIIA